MTDNAYPLRTCTNDAPEPVIAEQAPCMSRVLLLHMSLVVLAIGARSSHLNRRFAPLEMRDERPVEELPPIVGIPTLQPKGHRSLDLLKTLDDTILPAVPRRSQLRPSAPDISDRQRPDEALGHRTPAMRYGIGLYPSGLLNRPCLRPHRHLRPDRCVTPTASRPCPPVLHTVGREQAIDLRRTSTRSRDLSLRKRDAASKLQFPPYPGSWFHRQLRSIYLRTYSPQSQAMPRDMNYQGISSS